jgi:N-acetylglucosamine-6-phosphate deacetylase
VSGSGVGASERLVVVGGRVLAASGWRRRALASTGGVIAGSSRRGGPGLDATGLLVVPGLIDVQINGGFGRDLTSDPAAMWAVGARLPRHGVTAFLPTLVSPRRAEVELALATLAAGPPPGYAGAVPLGLHCEGPMISTRRLGVHGASRTAPPSARLIRGWTPGAGVRLVTLAPELPGAGAVIRTLVRRGVVVAAGHSDASYDEARRAFAWGVAAGTHLFNAMSGPDRREPGLAGALLEAAGVRVGIIADGIHVHPAMLRLAWEMKGGPAGIVLVSDAAPIAGRSAATGGLRLSAGVARTRDGTIAGSLTLLDRAVRNVVAFTGCNPADAALAASASPAAMLGLPDRGAIRPGARADLTLLDEDLGVAATVVGGSLVFDRDGRGRG